jgi:hypothetical protein
MRRLLALSLVSFSVALGGAAGLAAPAALAAGTATTAAPATTATTGTSTLSKAALAAALAAANGTTTPSLSLQSAEQQAQQAAAQQAATPAAPPVASSTTTTSNGLSSFDGLLIAIIAVLVLGGIAFYVWYDSRGAAAMIGHHASDDSMFARQHAGSKAQRKPRKHKVAERKRRKRGRAR